MDACVFRDALTGSTVRCTANPLEATVEGEHGCGDPCRSLFFPGCSLINYAMGLVQAVHRTLLEAGCVDGVSLVCCGKILEFEPQGEMRRAAFERQLVERIAATGVLRIVAACPNCVRELRAALGADARTQGVEVTPLPAVLAGLGRRIDEEGVRALVGPSNGEAPLRLWVHDSCPDRDTGEFAEGVRALVPASMVANARSARTRSLCCGSIVRAAGRPQAADGLAAQHGARARRAQASALVAACASCAYQLATAQDEVPALHYLEALYGFRVDWKHAAAYLKLRFLFDDGPRAVDASSSGRAFMGIDPCQGDRR